ncbi:MAG: integrin alpha [Planctomycetes bacterium]|nr:integrin alpha [Planctomycetota bacterium]
MRHRAFGLQARRVAVASSFLASAGLAQSPAILRAGSPGPGLTLASGSHVEDHMGVAVSGGGDFNGDGYPDLLIGGGAAQIASGLQPGAAAIVYGGPSMPPVTYLGDTSPGSVYLLGQADADFAGWALSFAGDVNADGYDDVVVGAYAADSAGSLDTGAAYVVFGGPVATGTYSLPNPPMGGMVLLGAEPNERVGFAVAGAGDVNGDGFDDVLVGAPLADTAGLMDGGKVFLLYGSPNPPPFLTEATLGANGVVMIPEAAFGSAGFAVAGAGDVNGDGLDDMLVGSPTFFTGGVFAGRAYLVAGGPSLPPTLLLGSALALIFGPPENGLCGHALAGVGDLDADGYDDILVGAPYYDPLSRADAGSAYLFLGGASLSGSVLLPGGVATTFVGANDLDRAGQALSGAGDVDGDGVLDFLIGAPYWDDPAGASEGRTYLILGEVPMPAYVDLALPGRSTVVLQGTEPAGILGFALSGCGDVDGDGYDDVVACAPYADPLGLFNGGTSALFYGGRTPDVVGAGCSGSAGAEPQAWFSGDFPRVGASTFALTLGGATPGSVAALAVGVPLPPTWPGIPLAQYGLPGCMFRVLPSLLLNTVVDPDGAADFPTPIPNSASLLGFSADVQWVVVGLPGPFVSASDPIRILVGP